MKIIFATHNPNKVAEMRAILAGLPLEISTALEIGSQDVVEEDGETLEENALKKARYVSSQCGEWTIADDTGLFIDALDGAPGVHSKRWGGKDITPDKLAQFTLHKVHKIPEHKRTATFITAIAIVDPRGNVWTFRGEIRGHIPTKMRGDIRPAFPYDTIFIPDGHDITFAEMSQETKNSLSHRGRALAEVRKFFQEHINTS